MHSLRLEGSMNFIKFLLTHWLKPGKNIQTAKPGVGMFHAQLDTEQYNSIYTAADEKLHQVLTEAEVVKLLQGVHEKLGIVQESSLRESGEGWHTGQGRLVEGATVTLVYDTRFAGGKGTETFLWHITDNGAALYGYHINSNDGGGVVVYLPWAAFIDFSAKLPGTA
jgi:hypothetical protein